MLSNDMMTSKHKYLLVFALFALVLMGGFVLWWHQELASRTEIVFLNVGQGDAILISQGSNQLLIDGGRNGKELLSRLGRHVPFWDRTIEFVIATHPDADHIGGLPSLLRTYRVEKVLSTGATSDTEISQIFETAISRYSKEKPENIYQGTKVSFPKGGVLEIEYPKQPLRGKAGDTNAGSIVARFTYGKSTFLFTGDLPNEETVLPNEKEVTVLKAAHHGSKYSTSQDFLNLVKPKETVISVGKNSYGHPDPFVLERLNRIGSTIHRTDTLGDVRYSCLPAAQACSFSR